MAVEVEEKVAAELNWPTSGVLTAILEAWTGGKRRMLLEGGTRSTKTWSALQALIIIAELAIDPLLISIVSETLPHLKKGCIRDFFKILGEDQDYSPYWSKTEYTYKRPNWKGVIEFFGADNDQKVRGLTREILYLNEPNHISQETGVGLDIRTSKFTIADWNPSSRFWIHDIWKDYPENAYNHSTYEDARHILPQEVIDNIESMKDKDPNWWKIYGLGLLGKLEGLVYPEFEQVDALPAGQVFYGLDYGTVDPCVLVRNVILGDKLYSEQVFYEPVPDVASIDRLLTIKGVKGTDPIYPDPDEPLVSNELRTKYNWNIRDTVKGHGSVSFGIQRCNQFYQYWTKESTDCITEQRNFSRLKDKLTGEYFEDKFTHRWSHGMGARRYAVASYKPVVHVRMRPKSYM